MSNGEHEIRTPKGLRIGNRSVVDGKNMLQIKRGGCEDYISAESLVECIHGLRAGLRQEVFGNFSKFIRLSARKSRVTSCLHISLNIFSIGFLAVSDCFTHTIKVVLPICTE